jgi:hypothetical protein
MDVGSENFRFTLDDPEKMARTIRTPMTSELHLDSLDRYLPSMMKNFQDINNIVAGLNVQASEQTLAKIAGPIFQPSTQSSTNNCLIQTKRNLLYGYFSRVALTQMYLNYNVPTVVTGYNDHMIVLVNQGAATSSGDITLRQGYYTVASLAVELQRAIRAATFTGTANPTPTDWATAITVTAPQNNQTAAGLPADPATIGYTFSSAGAISALTFCFYFPGTNVTQINNELKDGLARTYRLIGINRALFGYTPEFHTGSETRNQVTYTTATGGVPNLRPTDYIDVVSKTLSNYKSNKDENSALQAPSCVLGRIWLTEGQSAMSIANGYPESSYQGTTPYSFTKTWVNPNWSQWSPNQAVSSVDITLLDMWGNPLFWSSTYQTEWSATITATQ